VTQHFFVVRRRRREPQLEAPRGRRLQRALGPALAAGRKFGLRRIKALF
jgi:hypothetical protein